MCRRTFQSCILFSFSELGIFSFPFHVHIFTLGSFLPDVFDDDDDDDGADQLGQRAAEVGDAVSSRNEPQKRYGPKQVEPQKAASERRQSSAAEQRT